MNYYPIFSCWTKSYNDEELPCLAEIDVIASFCVVFEKYEEEFYGTNWNIFNRSFLALKNKKIIKISQKYTIGRLVKQALLTVLFYYSKLKLWDVVQPRIEVH